MHNNETLMTGFQVGSDSKSSKEIPTILDLLLILDANYTKGSSDSSESIFISQLIDDTGIRS